MARVFIVEPPTVNVEAARTFGKIHVLLRNTPRISALDCDAYAGAAIEALEKEDYKPKEDFLCLVGSISSLCVVISALVQRWGSPKCLIFNANSGKYVVRTLGRWAYQNKWSD